MKKWGDTSLVSPTKLRPCGLYRFQWEHLFYQRVRGERLQGEPTSGSGHERNWTHWKIHGYCSVSLTRVNDSIRFTFFTEWFDSGQNQWLESQSMKICRQKSHKTFWTSLRKFGQKSFPPSKICLLLHLWLST